jgi:hypothetical protein
LIRRTMLHAQRLAENARIPENNNAEIPFFGDVNYASLSTGLSDEQRQVFLRDVSRILIRLYETEWHYYLFVPKKRRADAQPITWPQAREPHRIPKTKERHQALRQREPNVTHLPPPSSTVTINTESKYLPDTCGIFIS